jgi:lipoprotein-releasing system permease protein
LYLPRFIAQRIAFNQQKSFSRFIIRLAMAATAISVAAMIVTMAFTAGFQQVISQKIFSFWGHIRVQHFEPGQFSITEDLPIAQNDTVKQILAQTQGIKRVETYATKNALLRSPATMDGILFKGVSADYAFDQLRPFLQAGRWMQFPDSGYSQEIVLSQTMASSLQVKLNDPVLIYFIQPGQATPRARKMTVVGFYKTGMEEYDRLLAWGDMRLVQRLNDWQPNEIGGYEIFLSDYRQMDSINNRVFEALPATWNSRTMQEIFPNIFDWLGLQDRTIAIVMIIMIIVAVLNLITCLIILVLERTRMVGLLKAIGARNGTIQQIFLYHGALIALAGIVVGNIIGIGLCWLQQRYGWLRLPEDMYYISKAEVVLQAGPILLVNLITFLICMLVLILPSFIINRVQPVKAIQFR